MNLMCCRGGLDHPVVKPVARGIPSKETMLEDLKQADAEQDFLLMDLVNRVHERQAAKKDQPEEIRPGESVAFLVCHDRRQ